MELSITIAGYAHEFEEHGVTPAQIATLCERFEIAYEAAEEEAAAVAAEIVQDAYDDGTLLDDTSQRMWKRFLTECGDAFDRYGTQLTGIPSSERLKVVTEAFEHGLAQPE